MTGKYLEEIIHIDDIRLGELNLITSGCGSGKTTFSIKISKILNHSLSNTLYLIDTAIGKEQLKADKGQMFIDSLTGHGYWKIKGITVMTYAGFAKLCEVAPEQNLWRENSLIICDELHNPIKWMKWQKDDDNLHKRAIKIIKQRIASNNNVVIAISATPRVIEDEFNGAINYMPLYGEARHYENETTINYSNLSLLLKKIPVGSKGIIYISRIKEILKYSNILKEKGHKTMGIWSTNENVSIPMNEEQLQAREYIITHKEIPDGIDILFINAACQTSISINTKIDFMIIHDREPDVIIQARGRYRNDLKTLYLHSNSNEIEISDEMLNKRLTKSDIEEYITTNNIRNEKHELLKQPSFIKLIEKCGYIVEKKKSGSMRYVIINKIS